MKNVLASFIVVFLTLGLSVDIEAKSVVGRQNENRSIKNQMEELHYIFGVNFIYDSSLKLEEIIYNGIEMSVKAKKESLENCLKTLFSSTGLEYEIMKKYIVLTKSDTKDKPKDYTIFIEEQTDTLSASYVTVLMEVPVNSTQTGLQRISGSNLNRGFAVLSSPDVIKTLQTIQGVSGGNELSSSIYVHGGTGSDNLYLLDGVPLYSVGHLLGLFSTFNSDVIDNVDFYKSGFPARYGGRMSSVVDVTTRDGDFNDYKGRFSIGLLDGRFQMEGPIVKDKTSFNIALRRSWMDILTIPAFGLYNMFRDKNNSDHISVRYAMTDLNAKFTHRFSQDNTLSLNLFAGQDVFASKSGSSRKDWEKKGEEYILKSNFRWGNILANLNWKNRYSDQLRSTISLYHVQSRSKVAMQDTSRLRNEDGSQDHSETYDSSNSRIYDTGLTANFGWIPSDYHHLRFGAEAVWHIYGPERRTERNFINAETEPINQYKSESFHYQGFETSAYIEDEMKFAHWCSANIGLRYVMFLIEGKTYHRLEPRAALKFSFGNLASLKFSYTDMNQFNHKLNASISLELPTSLWMPVTSDVAPMHSRQFAAGVYFNLPHNIKFNIEGYYKILDNIREYTGVTTMYPPIENWETDYTSGKGKAYGVEAQVEWSDSNTLLSAGYTLSWSKRMFPEVYDDWFFDMFDNRHKFNISATRKLGKKMELYAGWTFRSGNRITLPTQILPVPQEAPNGNNRYDYIKIYTSPNNAVLPSYHRLDLGLNIHRTTKRGNECIWNISVYNAYCYMNALNGFVYSEYKDMSSEETGFVTQMSGWVPIVPTFSYTLKF